MFADFVRFTDREGGLSSVNRTLVSSCWLTTNGTAICVTTGSRGEDSVINFVFHSPEEALEVFNKITGV